MIPVSIILIRGAIALGQLDQPLIACAAQSSPMQVNSSGVYKVVTVRQHSGDQRRQLDQSRLNRSPLRQGKPRQPAGQRRRVSFGQHPVTGGNCWGQRLICRQQDQNLGNSRHRRRTRGLPAADARLCASRLAVPQTYPPERGEDSG